MFTGASPHIKSTTKEEATKKSETSARDDAAAVALVERARGGDLSAFRELVERYQQRAYAVALSVVGNPHDAEEIAQEAFLKVYERLSSFRGDSSFFTWLYRIVFNLSIDFSRRRNRRREQGFEDVQRPESTSIPERVSEGEFTGHVEGPVEAADAKELRGQLLRALDSLSPEHRAVIMLREVEGLSYSEMSDVVGVSLGTVMSRLFHARKKLQKALEEYAPSGLEVERGE